MDAEQQWEQAFNTLDKRVFSADSIGGYDFSTILKKYANKASAILDYGCGKGQMVQRLHDTGFKNTFGTDPSELLLEHALGPKEKLKVLKNDTIPFADGSFDFVYCSGVLHHISWSQIPSVLKEIRRALKPGGHFLYAEPRKTLLRSLGHLVVMSPFSRISKNAAALSDCLYAEWPTYQPWLERQAAEFLPLCKDQGFEIAEIDEKLVTVIGVLKLA